MTKTRSVLRVLAVAVLAVVQLPAQSDSAADPGKAAQARSQEEFDRYLEIVTAGEPRQTIARVKEFVRQFPQSELASPAYQYEMLAFEQLNDFDGMLAAGRKAVAGNPDNLGLLLALAPAMANRAAGRQELLSQAEAYARRALGEMESIRLSKKVSLEQWSLQKRQMQSQAHAVLGTVALQRKQPKVAIAELETAIALAPQPQGVDFLRLGLAYRASGAKEDARRSFARAAELGPEAVGSLAREELKKL